MGFPSVGFPALAYGNVIPTPILDLLDFLNRIKLVATWVLWYLGLFDPSDPRPHWHEDRIPADPASSSPAIAELIKMRLPVVEFGCFVQRFGSPQHQQQEQEQQEDQEEEEESTCAVCLCCLEPDEEVRELCNCCHVFHRTCLDKWVDQGQTTCPLCRSGLLPEKFAGNQRRESWVVDRISYLFGEDLIRDNTEL